MASGKFTPRKPENFIEGQGFSKEDKELGSVDPTNLDESMQTPQDGMPDSSDVSFSEAAVDTSKKAVNMVRVRTSVDHSCCIGGVRYHFKKGVQKNVPEGVKAILLRANLLMPL